MQSKDYDELESLTPDERAKYLRHKDSFVLNNEHMDIIVNSLLPDDDATLGRLIRDLVAFNVDGDNALLDNASNDPSDITARRLLYADCKAYTDHYVLKCSHLANNRKGKTKDSDEQTQEQDEGAPDEHESEHPTLDEVTEYVRNYCLGGSPSYVYVPIARSWYTGMEQKGWRDEQGNPVRNWKKLLAPYANQAWKKQGQEREQNL